MSQVSHHIRLVILGGRAVGKTAIIKRFLSNTFNEKHRATVEDLFFKEFNLGTMLLKVDFLDTSGDFEFPAMRRLSIENGQAFLLVYSINDPNSFSITKKCFEEIREIRNDFQEVPIIFAGNKVDLPIEKYFVKKEEVTDWVYNELPRLRTKVIECSAKNNYNVKEIMKQFLSLSKISPPIDESGLKRRSSAHAPVFKLCLNTLSPRIIPELTIDTLTNPHGVEDHPIRQHLLLNRSPSSPKKTFIPIIDNQNASNSNLNLNSLTTNAFIKSNGNLNETNDTISFGQRLKPRSRSLIRRTSKKVNKVKDPNAETDNCYLQ